MLTILISIITRESMQMMKLDRSINVLRLGLILNQEISVREFIALSRRENHLNLSYMDNLCFLMELAHHLLQMLLMLIEQLRQPNSRILPLSQHKRCNIKYRLMQEQVQWKPNFKITEENSIPTWQHMKMIIWTHWSRICRLRIIKTKKLKWATHLTKQQM